MTPENKEREAFEAWAHSDGYDLSRWDINGEYLDRATFSAWNAWRARAQVAAAAPETQQHDLSDFTAHLRDASRYLLQNGQTKQGLAVQACITMLEDDRDD